MKKSPPNLKPMVGLSKSQRESLGLKTEWEARVREPNEALPITFKESKLNKFETMVAIRPGANDHLSIGRVGAYC